MEIKAIETRIEKKQEQIEKINKRIKKWSANLTDNELNAVKEYLHKKYGEWSAWRDTNRDGHTSEANELRRAYHDLADAQIQLDKYNNQLNAAIAKEDKLNMPKITIIWDFLQNWKKQAEKYIVGNAKALKKYYEIDHEYADMLNSKYSYIREHGEEAYKEAINEFKEQEKYYASMVNPLTRLVYSHREPDNINHEELNKILDKEVDNKYLALIEKVTKITGEITDAAHLTVGAKGDLDGIIIGEKGKAKVETIGAGGYNQNVILDSGRHGQIFHYRVLVKDIK